MTSFIQVEKPLVNLLRGWPSPDLLPAKIISAACQRILVDPSEYTPILQYGADEGYEPLRERLAQWLGRHYSVTPDADRICITGGASQNLACILQSFTDPNYTRAVWMIAPSYHLAANIFADSGFARKLKAVPEDDEGVNLDALETKMEKFEEQERIDTPHEPKPFKAPGPYRKLYRHIIYAVPTCANPSGKTMSLHRRVGLVKLARKYNALIICDDVYDFLQWPLEGPTTPERTQEMRLPRLCDIEMSLGQAENDPQGFGHTVSNGSFSKIAGPGIRTGWAEATPAFALGLSKTASSVSGGAPSQFCAGMLADLLRTGELEQFIEEKTRPALQERHQLIMKAIHQYMAPYGVTARESSATGSGIYGGYFVWLTLNHGPSCEVLAEAAMEEENIMIGRGSIFAVPGDDEVENFDQNIRLSFSWEPRETMVDAIKRLGALLKRMQGNVSYYQELAKQKRGTTESTGTYV
ncbi:hypothetical protein PT974_00497 [Cladobotryum mycophilum]|uniref:Aminotransferase class I/classII large domain-containing protein n=1 Tax=Cladobotryum mycophilum TaxID=491253 RepID=A0ABR0T126_9HYPO